MREGPLPGEELLCTLPERERSSEILALSDLSGNPAPLAHAVTHAGYAVIEGDHVNATDLGRNSSVVLAGDLLDRTPYFPALVKLIHDLRASGICLEVLYGNHDVAALATIAESPKASEEHASSPPVFHVHFNIKQNGFHQTLTAIREEYERRIGRIVPSNEERAWLHRREYDGYIPLFLETAQYTDGILALRRNIHDSRTAYAELFTSMQPATLIDDVLVVHAGISKDWFASTRADGITAANAEWKKILEDPTDLYEMAFGKVEIINGTCHGSKCLEASDMIQKRFNGALDSQSKMHWLFLDPAKCADLRALGVHALVRGHDPTYTHKQLVIQHEGIAIVNIEAKLEKNSRGYTRVSRGGNVFAFPPACD